MCLRVKIGPHDWQGKTVQGTWYGSFGCVECTILEILHIFKILCTGRQTQ